MEMSNSSKPNLPIPLSTKKPILAIMRSIIIGFGLLILCLLVLFKIAEVNFMRGDVKLEVVVAIAAILFFFAGLYINGQQQKKQATGQAAPPPSIPTAPTIDYEQIKKLGLTQREHEVLLKMAEGLSNQEIANQLFLSESTIKTHVSNIFFKLDVKRRTQAVQVARELGIVG
jgi:ATP/maltotriose-dependent transcriptional regulator MalT